MQKNNKNYTFLLSHSKKSGIYIRRFEVSKNVIHTTAFSSLFLIIGLVSFGVLGFVKDSSFAKSTTFSENQATLISEQPAQAQTSQNIAPKLVSYDSPNSMPNFGSNSGGPDDSYKLTFES